MARIRVGRWLLVLFPLLAAVVAMPACGGDGNGSNTSTAGGATPEATGVAPYTPGPGQTNGVTDTEIVLGSHLPLSGYAAAWGVDIKAGMDAYFAMVNDQGGVNGRKIRLIVYDDAYSGPLAAEGVRKLVEQDKVFAIMGGLGSATHSAVWKYLETNGVPDMFILAGDSKWTEPVVKTRFAGLVDYTDEGRILGQYIAENFPGKKLGIIEQSDEFGSEGEKGLREGIEGANMDVVVETYEETQNDLIAQVQRLKNQDVDVIAAYTMPIQAASVIKGAHQTLNWNVPVVVTGVNAVEVVGVLAGMDNIGGTVSVVPGHQIFEKDVPDIANHWDMMAEYAPGVTPSNLTLVGATVAAGMANFLRDAGPDLTREKFLDAAESLCDYMSTGSYAPSSMSPTDHRPIEVEMYVRATVDRSTDPPSLRWEPFGDPHGFETTKECSKKD